MVFTITVMPLGSSKRPESLATVFSRETHQRDQIKDAKLGVMWEDCAREDEAARSAELFVSLTPKIEAVQIKL